MSSQSTHAVGGFDAVWPQLAVFPLHAMRDGKCTCRDPACTNHGKHPGVLWSKLPAHTKCIGDGKCPACSEWRAKELDGLGLATGTRSGVFVIESDGAEADAWLHQQGMPRTLTVKSGSGRGNHYCYRTPADFVVPTARGVDGLREKVDVLAEGGYVVLQGSPHKSGGTYTIIDDAPVTDAPSWALARLREIVSKTPTANASEYEPDYPIGEDYLVDAARAVGLLRGEKRGLGKADGWVIKCPNANEHSDNTDFGTNTVLFAGSGAVKCMHAHCGRVNRNSFEASVRALDPEYDREAMRRALVPVLAATAANDTRELPPHYARTAGGLVFRTGGWDEPLPPRVYAVDQLLPAGSVSLFIAHGGSLKSMSTLSMCASVAQGKPWLGRFTVRAGEAAFLDYERSEDEAQRRLQLLRVQNLAGLSYCQGPSIRTDDERLWKDLETAPSGSGKPPSLVSIDSLTEGAFGLDENDREAAGPLIMAKRYAEKTGAAVIVIHHPNKGERSDKREKVRGSSALFAAVDAVYLFEQLEAPDGIARVRIVCIKMNLGRKPAPFAIEFSEEHGLIWYEEPAAMAGRNAETSEGIQAAIRLALADGPLPGIEALRKKIGTHKSKVCDALKLMVERREVVKVPDGYQLDDDAKRTARVLAFVRERGHEPYFNSVSRLADGAHVEPHDVERLLHARVIVRAVGADAGGFLPGSNWPSS